MSVEEDLDWTVGALEALESAGLQEIRSYINDLNILQRRALKREALLSESATATANFLSPLFGAERTPSHTRLQSPSSPVTASTHTPNMSDVTTSHQLAVPSDAVAFSPTPLTSTSRELDQEARPQLPSSSN